MRRRLRAWLVGSSLLVMACGPIGPIPGGRLRGDIATSPVNDWSYTRGQKKVQLETNPDSPHSVNAWVAYYRGSLYVPTSMVAGSESPEERTWVRNIQADPRVWLGIGGVVYELLAVRVGPSVELDGARDALIEKYGLARQSEQVQRAWIFRLDPR